MANINHPFANQVESIDEFGSAQQLYDRTVVFRILKKKRPVFRTDFMPHVSKILNQEDVIALLTTGRNDYWHIVLASDKAKRTLLSAGNFPIDDMFVEVFSVSRQEFQARIHWLPLYIPMEVVLTALGKSATVVSSEFERSKEGPWKGTATGVRSILLTGNMNDVPHLLELPFGNGSFSALVTITGRKPVCLRCQRVGHFRKKCRTPKCRHCHLFGHESEECRRPKTAAAYADVVSGPAKDLLQNDDHQEEESQSLLTNLNQAQARAADETEAKAGAEKSKAEAEVKEVAPVSTEVLGTAAMQAQLEAYRPPPVTIKRKEMFGSDSSLDSCGISGEEGFQTPKKTAKAMKPTWSDEVERSNSFDALQNLTEEKSAEVSPTESAQMEVVAEVEEVPPTKKKRSVTLQNRVWNTDLNQWVHVQDALKVVRAALEARSGEKGSAAYDELMQVQCSYANKIGWLTLKGLL